MPLLFPHLFEIKPGSDTLIAKIRVEVSPDVPPGTQIHVDPINGGDGSGHGRFKLHNELTHEGDGRYATILPRQVGGIFRVGVDGDISFFIRGDSNDDGHVDISDAVTVLGYLFLGDGEPACMDAADADDSGDLFITDAIVILSSLFASSQRMAPPFPEAGPDPNPDFLRPCKR